MFFKQIKNNFGSRTKTGRWQDNDFKNFYILPENFTALLTGAINIFFFKFLVVSYNFL